MLLDKKVAGAVWVSAAVTSVLPTKPEIEASLASSTLAVVRKLH
jgi:hypothetical protein